MLRYRTQMEWAKTAGYKALITECGFTHAVVEGQPDDGWRSDPAEWPRDKYIENMQEYERATQEDEYVEGLAIFTIGENSGWDSFESLQEWKEMVRGEVVEPPEEPELPEPGTEPETVNEAARYGVVFTHPPVQPGQEYWKAVLVEHYNPCKNEMRHHLFIDAVDGEGNRAYGQTLVVNDDIVVIDKPLEEPGTNAPLWKNTRYNVMVVDGIPSTIVENFHTGHPGERCPETNALDSSLNHHSFFVLFQKVIAGEGEVVEPPTEMPTVGEIRNEIWGHKRDIDGIPYNPTHAYPRYARDHRLGAPLNNTWDWRGLRLQSYVMGGIYAPIGEWGATDHLLW